MKYRLGNRTYNQNPEGVDCFATLLRGDVAIGTVIYYGSQGSGPYVTFTDRNERTRFEGVAGIGLDQERIPP